MVFIRFFTLCLVLGLFPLKAMDGINKDDGEAKLSILTKLPSDLYLALYPFLPPKEMGLAGQTCHFLNKQLRSLPTGELKLYVSLVPSQRILPDYFRGHALKFFRPSESLRVIIDSGKASDYHNYYLLDDKKKIREARCAHFFAFLFKEQFHHLNHLSLIVRSEMPNIRKEIVGFFKIEEVFSKPLSFSNLKSLELPRCSFSALSSLTSLEALKANPFETDDFNKLGFLTQLVALDISGDPFLRFFKNLTNLRSLNMDGSQSLSPENMQQIAQLKKLKSLSIKKANSQTFLNDILHSFKGNVLDLISQLPRLEELQLDVESFCDFTELFKLTSLKSLKKLSVGAPGRRCLERGPPRHTENFDHNDNPVVRHGINFYFFQPNPEWRPVLLEIAQKLPDLTIFQTPLSGLFDSFPNKLETNLQSLDVLGEYGKLTKEEKQNGP